MLGFAGKPEPEPTFKTRVERFWSWYAGVAPHFYAAIEAKNCASLAPDVSAKVEELLGFGAWEFGPGAGGRGHAFTLTAEGDRHRQYLASYWLSMAPTIEGWTFYPARQACEIAGARLNMAGRDFNPIEFWVTPSLNREERLVDLAVWHPLFEVMEERQRWSVLFLFLDQVLGEYGTQQWIGEIKLSNQRLAEAMPIAELPAFLRETQEKNDWKRLAPARNTLCMKPSSRTNVSCGVTWWLGRQRICG